MHISFMHAYLVVLFQSHITYIEKKNRVNMCERNKREYGPRSVMTICLYLG